MLCFSGCKQNNDSELIKTEAVEAQQTAFVEKEGEVLVPDLCEQFNYQSLVIVV